MDLSSLIVYLMMDSTVCRCCYRIVPVCTESGCVLSCVIFFVMLARMYSGLGSLAFCSSSNKFYCCSTCISV